MDIGHSPKDMDYGYNMLDENDKIDAIRQLEADGEVLDKTVKKQNLR